jgi:hypothetical protein
MTIRTRLLLFLLPAMISLTILISVFLSYNWYKEILEVFETKLKSVVVSCSSSVDKDFILNHHNDGIIICIDDDKPCNIPINDIKKELDIKDLYIIPKDTNLFYNNAISSHIKSSNSAYPKNDNSTSATIKELLSSFSSDDNVIITPIYKSKLSQQKIMSGYAAITDDKNNTIAYIGADVDVKQIDKKLQQGLLIIILSGSITILLITTALFAIASKIANPVQKLNNAALTIAESAGEYREIISVKGPKEIVELSHTLNTMSECLHENINRLKETSFLRERMYGEYECSMLLQHHMLEKVIDECQSDAIALKAITQFSDSPRGILLDIFDANENDINLYLVEAEEKNFDGMYQLLTNYKHYKKNLSSQLNHPSSSYLKMTLSTENKQCFVKSNNFYQPLFWSLKNKTLVEANNDMPIFFEPGDYFFICTQGIIDHFLNYDKVKALITKVMKFFGEDGLDICVGMLKKEISFTTKYSPIKEDIHLLCSQILY